MSDAIFCCFGLLRRKERVEAVLALLPEARREAVRTLLNDAAELPREQLIERLQKLRQAEAAGLAGLPGWERASPQVRLWLSHRARQRYGRQDHQS